MSKLDDTIRRIAQQVYKENDTSSRFGMSDAPFHVHDGQDSPRTKFTSNADTPFDYQDNAGRTLIVNDTAELVEFSGGVLALDATTGFTYLATCAGTPTGTPAGGNGATVYDTTADKLWVYNGSWVGVLLT